MRIGELEKQTGLGRHALRFYEKQGLLRGIRRTENGYRDYPDGIVGQVNLIKGMQSLGFGLQEIKPVVQAVNAGSANCADGAELLAIKRVEIRRQVEQLQQVEKRLAQEQQKLERRAAKNQANSTGTLSPGRHD